MDGKQPSQGHTKHIATADEMAEPLDRKTTHCDCVTRHLWTSARRLYMACAILWATVTDNLFFDLWPSSFEVTMSYHMTSVEVLSSIHNCCG